MFRGGHRGEFAFCGKWLKVEVSDLGLRWFISEQGGQIGGGEEA